jgi:hypothetical protein
VQIDDAVAALEERVRRADAHARRVAALVAEDGKEESPGVGEGTLLDRFYPAPVDADRDLVLRLARDRAGVAADAFPEIDGKAVGGHPGPLYVSLSYLRVLQAAITPSRAAIGTRGNVSRTCRSSSSLRS